MRHLEIAHGRTDTAKDLGPIIQRAVDNADPTNRVGLHLPPGRFRIGTGVETDQPFALYGQGKHQTFIEMDVGVTGFTIGESRSFGTWESTMTDYGFGTDTRGAAFNHLALIGENGDDSRAIDLVDRNDAFGLDHVLFQNLDQALRVGTSRVASNASEASWLRQAMWSDITVLRSGTLTQPAVLFTNTGASPIDVPNQIRVTGFECLYPEGVGLRIEQPVDGSQGLRRYTFNGSHFHGIGRTTGAQDLVQIAGKVQGVKMLDTRINTVDVGKCAIRLSEIHAGDIPRRIYLDVEIIGGAEEGIIVEKVSDLTIAGHCTGGKFFKLEPNCTNDTVKVLATTSLSATVDIDPTVADHVEGWVDHNTFRLPTTTQMVDTGGTVRTLAQPTGAGAASWV